MKILVACEESQTVTKEMRRLGHEAYSCDLYMCSGGHTEWHIMGDALPLINGNCTFTTVDGMEHTINGKWDMLIAFPPCTYLTTAGTRWFSPNCVSAEKIAEREKLRLEAAEFFKKFLNADCDRIAVENPVGYMNTHYCKATQIVQPYFFAKDENDKLNYYTKRTCLWLRGLPPLVRTNNLPRPKPYRTYINNRGKMKNLWWAEYVTGRTQEERAKNRSKTFRGIAEAMALQWAGKGDNIESNCI